jgi:hypothetical protein
MSRRNAIDATSRNILLGAVVVLDMELARDDVTNVLDLTAIGTRDWLDAL